MRPRAACWHGERMTVPGLARSKPQPAAGVRSITILGATGSIGASTVDLIKRAPERYCVEAISARRSAAALAKIAREVGARLAVVADPAAYGDLKEALAGSGIEAAAGEAGLLEAAQRPADWLMAAISGAVGLKPTLAAIERGATVALANKECLVCAGALFMRRAAMTGATVLPVDSEHNAIFQALGAGRREDVRRIILTASGGPFRTWSLEAIKAATPAKALKHPNWSMGPKITIDSASLMNKGLEVIEAFHLFALKPEEIDVLVHPQSVVHGLVEFRDGSVVAQLGSPDMRIPIAHCLAWPRRIDGPAARLDLARIRDLTFEAPDLVRFPALALARRVLQTGGAAPTVFNAANEVAVAEFLAGRIAFPTITALVEATLDAAAGRSMLAEPLDIDAALAVDHNARSLALALLPEIAVKSS
jgi:1-deoxy-D-xylulose-5-phosphate reductoisomerase